MPCSGFLNSQWELPATVVLLTYLYCNLIWKCLWLYLLIHLGKKQKLNGWSIFVFQYFSWWKYFWSFTLVIAGPRTAGGGPHWTAVVQSPDGCGLWTMLSIIRSRMFIIRIRKLYMKYIVPFSTQKFATEAWSKTSQEEAVAKINNFIFYITWYNKVTL